MNSADVISLWNALEQQGIAVWIDGGWAVDAVIGRQTRPHNDLDIAIEAKSLSALRRFLSQCGYREIASATATVWNFVSADEEGRSIDVHAVVLDEAAGVWGDPLDGIAYPAGSLTGQGVIAGVPVRCVSAEFQLRFKTGYPPREIDRQDVAQLCALLGRQVPDSHK